MTAKEEQIKYLSVRVTSAQHAAIRAAAEARGLNLSEYCRDVLLTRNGGGPGLLRRVLQRVFPTAPPKGPQTPIDAE